MRGCDVISRRFFIYPYIAEIVTKGGEHGDGYEGVCAV